ncbi:mannose-1-phosphate guanylyltransferase [Balneicella halophila]|uniref:mannose-1-phosphate guanylyltransferase n=1 Tax=Balneicella halophila TaxID=1537566 RepID=A0A7L4UNL4_BALHA|nr:mannose-1-phosphate guanylyltransferase [Balneicella halophila]PVX50691.1 mannose-1-phosphate guanylyltransferase [Balneicella halophila]
MINNNHFCVIMAGGVGTRFWPLSTHKVPKQFIDVLGVGRTFIQMTYDRFRRICLPENFIVVTGAPYKDLVLEQLPELQDHQVLLEPHRKNTAPCIAYANHHIAAKNENATIVVTPADHLIMKEDEFERVIKHGFEFVEEYDALLTIGLEPTRPETGYGYIQKGVQVTDEINEVKTFTEKPNKELAKVFCDSHEFLWNSGMFLWSLKTINRSFELHLPHLNNLFAKGKDIFMSTKEQDFINSIYADCQNISIDYGIMEKAHNVYVHTADFGWSDLGTWGSLYANSCQDNKNNSIVGKNVKLYESSGCIVHIPDDHIAVVQGLKDYIVVQKENRLLVCKRDEEQKIRQFVNDLMLDDSAIDFI